MAQERSGKHVATLPDLLGKPPGRHANRQERGGRAKMAEGQAVCPS